jgi:predicted Zn-dependent protease
VRGAAWERQGDALAAWTAWDEGQRRFPDDATLRRARVTALVGFGMHQVAVEEARPLLDRAETSPADWLTLTEALRRAAADAQARTLLEEAHLRFPADTQRRRALALAHLRAGHPRAAARLLAAATSLDPALYAPAAEAFRQAGDLVSAGRMNASVPDPVEKTRQRLGLLLEAGSWARATALAERVTRLSLHRDDAVRYGLAVASARLGAFPEAEAWLDGIAAPDVFEDATQLREAMQTCRDGGACP